MPISFAEMQYPEYALLDLLDREDLIPAFKDRPAIAGKAVSSALDATFQFYKHVGYAQRLAGQSDLSQVVAEIGLIVLRRKSMGPETLSGFESSPKRKTSPGPLPREWQEALKLLDGLDESAFLTFEVALKAALDASAAVIEEADHRDALPAALQKFVVDRDPPGEMLGVKEAAQRLGIARPTVYEWLKLNKLLGWPRGTTRGHLIPAEQILGRDRVVEGLPDIVAAVGDPTLAWHFLDRAWPFAGGEARPIDKLKTGEPQAIQSVIDAVPSYLESTT